jgi:hypothetical protein
MGITPGFYKPWGWDNCPDVGEEVTLTRGDYRGRRAVVREYWHKMGQPVIRVEVILWGTRTKTIDVQYQSVQRDDPLPIVSDPTTGRTEAILGFRHFMFHPDKPLLRSWHRHKSPLGGFIWKPNGATAAVCERGREAPCAIGHRCGLYALKDLDAVTGSYYQANHVGQVLAAVGLWGIVLVGDRGGVERGYRAQFGRVVAVLCDNWQKADQIHAIAQAYGIPVTHSEKLFGTTNWVEQWNSTVEFEDAMSTLQEVEDGHGRQGDTGSGGAAEGTEESTNSTEASSSACRTLAKGASTIHEMKHLYREGLISRSNMEEVLDLE